MVRLLFLIIVLFAASGSVSGGIIVTVESKTIAAGDMNAYADVFISGVTGDTLGQFGYTFDITGAVAQSGFLQFRPVQLDSEQSQSNYVFAASFDPGSFNASPTSPTNLAGGDVLGTVPNVGDSVPIDGGTFLLARLDLQHLASTATPGTYNFTIALDPLGSFFDRDALLPGAPGGFDEYAAVDIIAIAGNITVNVAAVPEPATFGLLFAGGVALVIRRRRVSRLPQATA